MLSVEFFPGGIVGAILTAAVAVALGIGVSHLMIGNPVRRELDTLTVLLRVCDSNPDASHVSACICGGNPATLPGGRGFVPPF